MNTSTYISVTTTVRLTKDEGWQHKTESKGFLFRVSTITWSGGDFVDLRGPGVKADGSGEAYINRTEMMRFSELSENLQTSLKLSRIQEISKLVNEELSGVSS